MDFTLIHFVTEMRGRLSVTREKCIYGLYYKDDCYHVRQGTSLHITFADFGTAYSFLQWGITAPSMTIIKCSPYMARKHGIILE